MMKPRQDAYYTAAQAARILAVSPSTIWRWIESGNLPAYRVGPRSIRIKKEDLELMIKPARSQQVDSSKDRMRIESVTAEELTRRKGLVAQILARRKKRVITPLTSADLVQQVREEEKRSHAH